MKSKFTLALTVALLGGAAFAGNLAYAGSDLSCSDWSFNTPGCAAYISAATGSGKTATAALTTDSAKACADWSFNTPGCAAYIDATKTASAKAATATTLERTSLACADWSFNDPACSAAN